MKYCDLHMHSVFSDGSKTPEELVEAALSEGLAAVALTDHNTMDGAGRFVRAAEGRIEACTGCEFTTAYEGREMHLLGLFLPAEDPVIRGKLRLQAERKEESNRITIENLAADGYDLSYEEFLSLYGYGIKNRSHIGKYLMIKGIVSDVSEAIGGILDPKNGYYRESGKADFAETVSLIRERGGVSVWAHPLYGIASYGTCERLLREAKDLGLDGAEVMYSTYTKYDTAFMTEMCEKYGLLKSGGSDYHGPSKKRLYLGTGYGDLRVPEGFYGELKRKHAERLSALSCRNLSGTDGEAEE